MSLDLVDYFLIATAIGIGLFAIYYWLPRHIARLEQVLWRKGYRSPFVHASLLLARVSAVLIGIVVVIFGLVDVGRYAPQWLRIAGATAGGLVACALVTAVVTAFGHWIPPRARKDGWKRSRFPWALLAPFSFVPLAIWVFAWAAAGFETKNSGQFGTLIPMSFAAYAICRNMAKRQTVRPLEELVADDPRGRVLYLRAFDSEAEPFAMVSLKERRSLGFSMFDSLPNGQALTFEAYMGKHIGSALGPFVALGDPYDYLPPVGAARTYVPDDNWQEHFKRQCTQCAKILVVPGVSGNLAWELSWIAAWSLRHKLFILTPHHSLKEKGSQYWDMFAAICNNSGIQLGVYPGPGAVVGFRADGVPWVLGRDASTPEAYVALVAMGRPPQARSRRLFVV